MSRAWSLALPVVTVLVVVYALLVAGAPRPTVAARVYGGPTEGRTRLSLRIETVQREGENESPFLGAPLSVRARASSGESVNLTVPRADRGVADVDLSFNRPIQGPVQLELHAASGALLARGELLLASARWTAHARRRGGWIQGRHDGGLSLSVAPERGAFVVGFADSLLIRVERSGVAVQGAKLACSADGAQLGSEPPLSTDARGRARLSFAASELNPTLRVEASTSDGLSGLIETRIPVVPGGFHAVSTPSGLRVEVAVPRAEAFFSVVSDNGRVAGGVLGLHSNGRGGSLGMVQLPPLPQPAWLVVSSELDLNSAAAIGWPLDAGAEPAQTFDVADQLLLDGLPAAFQTEQERRSRVRWLCATFIALAFLLSVALLVLRVRAADRDISQHLRAGLDAELVLRIAPRRLLPLVVALLTIGLGFVGLGLIVLARSR
jgi:hypothetical protein